VACEHGRTSVVAALVKGRANLNAQDDRGATPLHIACAFGNDKAMQILLDADNALGRHVTCG
jgi:ankyrin repeat protein